MSIERQIAAAVREELAPLLEALQWPADVPQCGLTQAQAAKVAGVGQTKFRELVADRKAPQPNPFSGRWSPAEMIAYRDNRWRP